MRSPKVILLFAAWLCASGVQWDVLQVVAWGRMFVRYSQSQSVSEAVKSTMTNRCEMCVAVSQGRAQQEDGAAIETKVAIKLPVTVPTHVAVVVNFVSVPLIQRPVRWTTIGRSAPPLPPPRLV